MNSTRLRRGAAVLALLSALSLTAVACGSGDSGSATGSESASGEGGGSIAGKKVIYSNYGAEIPFFQQVGKGATDQAGKRGLDFEVSTSEIDPSKQIDSVDNAIAQQPAGMIVSPLDGSALVPSIKQAVDSGIPVVLLADTLTEDAGQLSYVGADFGEIGRMKATYIADKLGDGGTVAMVNGPRGLGFVEEQAETAREVFEAKGIEVVDDIYTKAVSPDEGLTATQNVLTRHPDVGAIFYSGDDAALGGIEAVEKRKIEPGKVLLVGADGSDAAIEAIRSGAMAYTVAQCAFEQGVIATNVLSDYMESGKKPEPRTITPVIEVDSENVKDVTKGPEWAKCEGR